MAHGVEAAAQPAERFLVVPDRISGTQAVVDTKLRALVTDSWHDDGARLAAALNAATAPEIDEQDLITKLRGVDGYFQWRTIEWLAQLIRRKIKEDGVVPDLETGFLTTVADEEAADKISLAFEAAVAPGRLSLPAQTLELDMARSLHVRPGPARPAYILASSSAGVIV
jgi:hypothetical protein